MLLSGTSVGLRKVNFGLENPNVVSRASVNEAGCKSLRTVGLPLPLVSQKNPDHLYFEVLSVGKKLEHTIKNFSILRAIRWLSIAE